jgi:hypothetical protein
VGISVLSAEHAAARSWSPGLGAGLYSYLVSHAKRYLTSPERYWQGHSGPEVELRFADVSFSPDAVEI